MSDATKQVQQEEGQQAEQGIKASTSSRTRIPALFICHGGGPMPLMPSPNGQENLVELWKSHRTELFPTAESAPKAIVIVSAHYETRTMKVGAAATPKMMFDYGGFPPETYQYKYPAPGNPELASRVVEMLAQAGIPGTESALEPNRGFDHGVFVPLMLMFPEAKIPVIPISVLRSQDVAEHVNVGKALSSLRDEGVFVLGSGASSHNMRMGFSGTDVGKTFNQKLARVITEGPRGADEQAVVGELSQYLSWEGAKEAQVQGLAEHLMPLFTVLGTSKYLSGRPPPTEKEKKESEDTHDGTPSQLRPPVAVHIAMGPWVETHFTFWN